jgi:hypothetical protein
MIRGDDDSSERGDVGMEKIAIRIGTIENGRGGIIQSNVRVVEFVGVEVARRRVYGYNYDLGQITDSRGVRETLYRAEDGRYIVHVCEWEEEPSGPTVFWMECVSEEDLALWGRFEALGREAGLGRSLTLDEALSMQDKEVG